MIYYGEEFGNCHVSLEIPMWFFANFIALIPNHFSVSVDFPKSRCRYHYRFMLNWEIRESASNPLRPADYNMPAQSGLYKPEVQGTIRGGRIGLAVFKLRRIAWIKKSESVARFVGVVANQKVWSSMMYWQLEQPDWQMLVRQGSHSTRLLCSRFVESLLLTERCFWDKSCLVTLTKACSPYFLIRFLIRFLISVFLVNS